MSTLSLKHLQNERAAYKMGKAKKKQKVVRSQFFINFMRRLDEYPWTKLCSTRVDGRPWSDPRAFPVSPDEE
jgi:hypothetical protein